MREPRLVTNLLQPVHKMGVTLTKLFDGWIGQRHEIVQRNSRRQAVSKVSLDALTPVEADRDRAGKKQALIVAALKLFANKGYDATTTREIAASAGCAEGLIHRYFNGKAGLLPALMEYRVSQEVADLTHHIRPAHTFEDEYLQLVSWALEHMWEDREFLRVAIPRALLDPGFGQVLRQVGPLQRARAIGQRLKKFRECRGTARNRVRCSGPIGERDRLHVWLYASGGASARPENLYPDCLCDRQAFGSKPFP